MFAIQRRANLQLWLADKAAANIWKLPLMVRDDAQMQRHAVPCQTAA